MPKDDGQYRFIPLTRAQLVAYAKKLHADSQAKKNPRERLSWPEAMELADKHEKERAVNYAQLNDNLRRHGKFPQADGGLG